MTEATWHTHNTHIYIMKVARQAPLSMGFSRQEYRSGLPFPSPGDLPDPGIQPKSTALQANSLPSGPPKKPSKGAYFILNAQ